MNFFLRLSLFSLCFVCHLPLIADDAKVGGDAGAKKQEADLPAGPVFAFVCLNEEGPASEKAWKKSLEKWFTLKSTDEIKEFEIEADEEHGKKASTVSFTIRKQAFMIGMMGAPVPEEDIEYACMNSFLWPEAKKKLEKHKSHMIVMCLGDFGSGIKKGLALSRVIAAATECHDTAGVYWGYAATVHSPEMFRKNIKGAGEKPEDLPTLAWVGYLREAGEVEGTVNFYTRGLTAFGAKELEVLNSKEEPAEIFEFLTGISTYLLMNGDVIKDGDTVGIEGGEKINTKWADSHIGLEGRVIRIEY